MAKSEGKGEEYFDFGKVGKNSHKLAIIEGRLYVQQFESCYMPIQQFIKQIYLGLLIENHFLSLRPIQLRIVKDFLGNLIIIN